MKKYLVIAILAVAYLIASSPFGKPVSSQEAAWLTVDESGGVHVEDGMGGKLYLGEMVYETPAPGLTAVKYEGNPILTADDIPWATHYPEHPQVIKVGTKYHMYFHVAGPYPEGLGDINIADQSGYQIGHAIADNPLGPWTADPLPTLAVGANGAWDDGYVACPSIYKRDETHYFMLYSGWDGGTQIWAGIAVASNPYGPFTKINGGKMQGAPVWVGQVFGVEGQHYMTAGFENALDIYQASVISGPWSKLTRAFALGEEGAWNSHGSMGEAGIVKVNDTYYLFFGGRNATEEIYGENTANARPYQIGLATSTDLLTWTEWPDNPIITTDPDPYAYDGYRLSEVSAYYENGIFYVYYTSIGESDVFPVGETLSVATVRIN